MSRPRVAIYAYSVTSKACYIYRVIARDPKSTYRTGKTFCGTKKLCTPNKLYVHHYRIAYIARVGVFGAHSYAIKGPERRIYLSIATPQGLSVYGLQDVRGFSVSPQEFEESESWALSVGMSLLDLAVPIGDHNLWIPPKVKELIVAIVACRDLQALLSQLPSQLKPALGRIFKESVVKPNGFDPEWLKAVSQACLPEEIRIEDVQIRSGVAGDTDTKVGQSGVIPGP